MDAVRTPFALAGRTALVTGSSSGIGQAAARALAEAGARVALHGLEPLAELEALACTLPGATAAPVAFSCDLAAAGSATALADAAMSALGHVDILVLSAAVQFRRAWTAITQQEFDRQIDVNLRAALVLLQRLVPPMQARGWGRVVTVGSVQQMKPHPEMLVYAGTKAAQLSWVRNLAMQVGADGVTVNNIAPGIIDTPRNADILSDDAARAQVSAPVPARRVGVPADCAGAILLLCSDAGAYINGADLAIDGGLGVA